MGKHKKAKKVAEMKKETKHFASSEQDQKQGQLVVVESAVKVKSGQKAKVIQKSQPKEEAKQEQGSSEFSEVVYRTQSQRERRSSGSEQSIQDDKSELPPKSERRHGSRKSKKGRHKIQDYQDYLDVQASESSGDLSSEPASEDLSEHRRERADADQQVRQIKGEGKRFMEQINQIPQDQINAHYELRNREQMGESRPSKKREQFQRGGREDVDLFQVNCSVGMEVDLVGGLLNKARYASQVPDYFCQIVSAMCVPRKFPGYIFLEGQNIHVLRKTLEGLKGIKQKTLKKIELQLFSSLLHKRQRAETDMKVEQYVKIKTGIYRDDLAQVTRLIKRGVMVQVVPRIDFQDISKRMEEIEQEYNKLGFTPAEIMKLQNNRFKELTSAKSGFGKSRPDKRKFQPADFQPFTKYAHTKNIKITADGLLLVYYPFQEVEEPRTSFSPMEVLMLNRNDLDKADIIKKESKNVRMALDVKRNDMVEVIFGELRGCYGCVVEAYKKMSRIRCLNKELKDVVVDETNANLQKMFREGDSVVVISGDYRGEEGQVYKNGIHRVSVITSNRERVRVLKRDVQMLMESSVTFPNDLGINKDNIVKTRTELGIVCESKKTFVEFVTTKNEIRKGMNNEISNVTNFRNQGSTSDRVLVTRDCIVLIESGFKKGKTFKVKQIYSNFLFLHDPAEDKLFGNWVEPAENCRSYLMVTPRIEARFLENEARFQKMQADRPKPENYKKPQYLIDLENDKYGVGRNYMITHGVFKGVKGIIVATFKTHIEVCVFNNKTEKIDRTILVGGGSPSRRRSRSNSDAQASPEYRGRGFLSNDQD